MLAGDWGVPTAAVPVAVLVIALAGAAGAALGGRADRLRGGALLALLVVAAALLAVAALWARPAALVRGRGLLRAVPRGPRRRRGPAAGRDRQQRTGRPSPRSPAWASRSRRCWCSPPGRSGVRSRWRCWWSPSSRWSGPGCGLGSLSRARCRYAEGVDADDGPEVAAEVRLVEPAQVGGEGGQVVDLPGVDQRRGVLQPVPREHRLRADADVRGERPLQRPGARRRPARPPGRPAPGSGRRPSGRGRRAGPGTPGPARARAGRGRRRGPPSGRRRRPRRARRRGAGRDRDPARRAAA